MWKFYGWCNAGSFFKAFMMKASEKCRRYVYNDGKIDYNTWCNSVALTWIERPGNGKLSNTCL